MVDLDGWFRSSNCTAARQECAMGRRPIGFLGGECLRGAAVGGKSLDKPSPFHRPVMSTGSPPTPALFRRPTTGTRRCSASRCGGGAIFAFFVPVVCNRTSASLGCHQPAVLHMILVCCLTVLPSLPVGSTTCPTPPACPLPRSASRCPARTSTCSTSEALACRHKLHRLHRSRAAADRHEQGGHVC